MGENYAMVREICPAVEPAFSKFRERGRPGRWLQHRYQDAGALANGLQYFARALERGRPVRSSFETAVSVAPDERNAISNAG